MRLALSCRTYVQADRAAGESGSKFLYVFKAALNGPHAPPPGRASVAALALRLRPRNTPGGWRGSGKPQGAAAERQTG